MQLVILKNNLKEAVDALGRMSGEGTNSLPILKNFLIRTSDGKILVSSTNLELAITRSVPGKIVETGGITIPLAIMGALVSNLQSEKVQLDVEGTTLSLKTDNYQAKIQGLREDDFPIIPKIIKPESSFAVPAEIMAEALAFVANAAQGAAGKPELHGVLLDFQKGMLNIVATDNFRLAKKTIYESQLDAKNFAPARILIPARTVNEVLRVFKNSKSHIQVEFDENQILFRDETSEIISRLIGGNFPDYEAIIPKETSSEATVNRIDFMSALKLTSSFADRLNEVRLSVKEAAKALEASSANQSIGENKYLIPAKVKGDPIEVVFNWRFLLEGIKDLPSETINLKFVSDARPATVTGDKDTSYFYLLMPIKGA